MDNFLNEVPLSLTLSDSLSLCLYPIFRSLFLSFPLALSLSHTPSLSSHLNLHQQKSRICIKYHHKPNNNLLLITLSKLSLINVRACGHDAISQKPCTYIQIIHYLYVCSILNGFQCRRMGMSDSNSGLISSD